MIAYANEGITVRDGPLGPRSGSPNTEFIIPDKGVVYGTVRCTRGRASRS